MSKSSKILFGEIRTIRDCAFWVTHADRYMVHATDGRTKIKRTPYRWRALPLLTAGDPAKQGCPASHTDRWLRQDRLGYVRCRACYRWVRPRENGLLPGHNRT